MMLSFIPLYSYSKKEYKFQLFVALLIIIALFATVYFIPATHVKARVLEVFSNLTDYSNGNANTSIGLRLEMVRASLNIALAHPLLGIGDNFNIVIQEMARLGTALINPDLKDTHNEFVDAFLKGGIAGVLQLMIFYFAPLVYFIKTAKLDISRNNEHLMALAVGGIVLVMACIDFGLSVNVFTRQIGKAFYFIMVFYLIALCEVHRASYDLRSTKF